MLRTYIPKANDIDRKWWVADAEGQRLGRLATRIATILRGKHRPIYTPHLDTGDFVIIVNADKIVVTGRKLDQKTYFSHSTYPGGSRFRSMRQVMNSKPELVVRKAVWGMLPHNRLGRKLIRKLKIYSGPDHPHEAQQPVKLELKDKYKLKDTAI